MGLVPSTDEIDVEPKGTRTAITIPTSLLWLLVFGGIGILTWNVWLLSQQLAHIQDQLDRHLQLMSDLQTKLEDHAGAPSHGSSARFMLELDRRVQELEGMSEP